MNHDSRIYIAGHRGLVGSAIHRRLAALGHANFLLRTHAELDLENQAAVDAFFAAERPEYVFLAAAKVGGIHANSTYPADFIYNNLLIEVNVIHAAWRAGVKKLLFLGSSCIYPKHAPQPMKEEHLLTSELEPTNEAYAVAKIAGIKLCQSYNRQYGTNFISVMPTNLYGPGDNYDPMNSHVLPALIRRFHAAKMRMEANATLSQPSPLKGEENSQPLSLEENSQPLSLEENSQPLSLEENGQPLSLEGRGQGEGGPGTGDGAPDPFISPDGSSVKAWGSGSPRREFLYSDDCADACVHLMRHHDGSAIVNVGTGEDITIRELTHLVADTVGYRGEVRWDPTQPDGTPRKLLDVSRLHGLGWRHRTGMEEGLRLTYADFLASLSPSPTPLPSREGRTGTPLPRGEQSPPLPRGERAG